MSSWDFEPIAKVQVLSITTTRRWKFVILAIFRACTCQDTAWTSKKNCRKRTENLKITKPSIYFPCVPQWLSSLFHPKKWSYENCYLYSLSSTFQAQFYCASPLKSSYSTVLSSKLLQLWICQDSDFLRGGGERLNDYLRTNHFFSGFSNSSCLLNHSDKWFCKNLSPAFLLRCPAQHGMYFRSSLAPGLLWAGYTHASCKANGTYAGTSKVCKQNLYSIFW